MPCNRPHPTFLISVLAYWTFSHSIFQYILYLPNSGCDFHKLHTETKSFSACKIKMTFTGKRKEGDLSAPTVQLVTCLSVSRARSSCSQNMHRLPGCEGPREAGLSCRDPLLLNSTKVSLALKLWKWKSRIPLPLIPRNTLPVFFQHLTIPCH